MKRILLSILTAGAVGALAFGASQAFFSDVETSENNTFVAGSVDLRIDSNCSYYQNGQNVECRDFGNWPEKNLVGERFFNFLDVKPGDYGENTISLHVIDNDAWACVEISPLENNENGCNDPELEVPDSTCTDPGAGELADELEFFAWSEIDGDNIFEEGETPLFRNLIGPASNVLGGRTYALADLTTGGIPLVESTTYYIGLAWCAGTMTPDDGDGNMPGGFLNCNGEGMGNIAQTDSLVGDISFNVEQARNNPGFLCSDLD